MTDRIKKLYDYILSKKHRSLRAEFPEGNLSEEFCTEGLSHSERMTERLCRALKAETPVLLEGQKIAFMRTVKNAPDIFTEAEWKALREKHFIHESGYLSNICPGYARVISTGLLSVRNSAEAFLPLADEFFGGVIRSIDAVIKLSDRYAELAAKQGDNELAEILHRVPRYPARTLREAFQFFRILHFALWAEGEYHNTIGRFDLDFYPYLKSDIAEGRLDRASAFELTEEFFISFNIDSDLYPGVQQGDNGQSLVLGGCDSSGNTVWNMLTELALEASCELKLIDPKINLRVSSSTPLNAYELGTRLTREGLGFPQYSNDDVVIPGLIKLGYSPEDARNYVVAACWEYIIPGKGMEIVNIAALSFPKAIDTAIRKTGGGDFDHLLANVKSEINSMCESIAEKVKRLYIIPAPFMSVLFEDCITGLHDISTGAKYNNYGIHGTGIATAADSLAALEKIVYADRSETLPEFISKMYGNFESDNILLNNLRYHTPKMGNDDDRADRFASLLLNMFSEALEPLMNERGGRFRAGTGTAMYYLRHAAEIGASPDGRLKDEPFGTNFSPSIFARIDGPYSVINSFTKPDFTRAINGGPLTLEFHGSVFSEDENLQKIASLVMYFIKRGGHQLQLNAINAETLRDAQNRPEAYPRLIVRVWGWSAYFVELDREYQDHVISRQEYKL